MTLTCPACRKAFEDAGFQNGERIACPRCGKPLRIPEQVLALEEEAVDADPAPRLRPLDWDKVRLLRRERKAEEERQARLAAERAAETGLSCPGCRSRRTHQVPFSLTLPPGCWTCPACGHTWVPPR